MNLAPHQLITTTAQWQACLKRLQQAPRLALDLEANSMYVYREQICLIQISIPEQDYIIDPRVGLDLSGLGYLVEDKEIEKIFHAAEYDLILMKREYGWELQNLFDTMWSARILGYPDFGLASLVKKVFGVTLDKRFQRANWCKRPLLPDQLAYAQRDTHYLLALRDHLDAELEKGDHLEEAREIFAQQSEIELADNSFEPENFWSINGIQTLGRQGQTILRALNIYRDSEARRRNQPLFKVFSNNTLVELAHKAPQRLEQLRAVQGMSSGQINRYGRQLLQLIDEAAKGPPPAPAKRSKRTPDDVIARYDRLHAWRKQAAKRRGVESDVILNRSALWEIAYANPQTMSSLEEINSLGSWRRQRYGQEILELLLNHS